MSKQKIHFAVVGYGHIGKRHATVIRNNPECQLTAICDILPAAEVGKLPAKLPYYQNLGAMLSEKSEIEVVCICTPNGLHAAQAIECLEAGKHVVIEKPMGLTKAECEEVIFKSLNVNRRVFCVMQNRYSPPVRLLKDITEQGRLGDIFMVEINCYWNRDDRYYLPDGQRHAWHGSKELDGGVLFTQFSHFVDLLYWIFGDVTDIRTRTRNFMHEHTTEFADSGVVSFDLVRGGTGCLTFSTAVYDRNFASNITVIGSRGTIRIGGQYMDKVTYCHIADYELPALAAVSPPNDYGGYKGSAANHHYVIENVADVLRDRTQTATNALEGMKVTDIIERMYAAE